MKELAFQGTLLRGGFPKADLTRSEAVEVLYNTIFVKEKVDDLLDFEKGYQKYLDPFACGEFARYKEAIVRRIIVALLFAVIAISSVQAVTWTVVNTKDA